MKYLNPRADLTFKRIFGEHPDLVMSLLNALLPLKEGEDITEIEYLPVELIPDNSLRKYSIVDMRCLDKLGRQFLVEIQTTWSPELQYPLIFNTSEAYIIGCDINVQDELTQSVYVLNLDSNLFPLKKENYYHHYDKVYAQHENRVIEGLQLVVVDLLNFPPHVSMEKEMRRLWLRFLTEIDEKVKDIPNELLSVPEIQKALSFIEKATFSDAEIMQYESFWEHIGVKKTLYTNGIRRYKEEGFSENEAIRLFDAKTQGVKEGFAVGKARGLDVGIAKGENKECYRVATELKQLGVVLTIISRATGIPLEEIDKL